LKTIRELFAAAARASSANKPTNVYLDKLKAEMKNSDFYRELEKSLDHCPGVSAHIAASESPMSRALEVNRMDADLRWELCLQVDLGL